MKRKHYGCLLFIAIVWVTIGTCNWYLQKDKRRNELDKKATPPSVWISTWYPKDSNNHRSGRNYNDLIKINENQYLYVGKDGFGNTFDSSIITINK